MFMLTAASDLDAIRMAGLIAIGLFFLRRLFFCSVQIFALIFSVPSAIVRHHKGKSQH
jgi:hypothetical protein